MMEVKEGNWLRARLTIELLAYKLTDAKETRR